MDIDIKQSFTYTNKNFTNYQLYQILNELINKYNSKLEKHIPREFKEYCQNHLGFDWDTTSVLIFYLSHKNFLEFNKSEEYIPSKLGIDFHNSIKEQLEESKAKIKTIEEKTKDEAGIAKFNNKGWVKGLRVTSLGIGIIGGILGGIAFFNNKNAIPTDNMVTKEFLKEYTEKFHNEVLNHTNSDTLNIHP